MRFSVKPEIADCESLVAFFKEWEVGAGDLVVTNQYILEPAMAGATAPCDALFVEKYGTGEPSDDMINAIIKDIEGKGYKRIIAIGGGSVMDISKLLLFGDGPDVQTIADEIADLPRKRNLVAIPTTCGTGSEVTGVAALEFIKLQTKKGVAGNALYPDEAVLIPDLLSSMPYEVFAASSIDALIHAMESHMSPKANAFSRAMGRRAIVLILRGYQRLVTSGKQELPEDMTDFLTASTMAGIAFANAGCATVHALSYPISGAWHVTHGKANYMVLGATFAYYKEKDVDLWPLEEVLCNVFGCERSEVWVRLTELLDNILTRQPISQFGGDEAKCREMAASCHANQQRLLVNSPMELSVDDLYNIYVNCLQ